MMGNLGVEAQRRGDKTIEGVIINAYKPNTNKNGFAEIYLRLSDGHSLVAITSPQIAKKLPCGFKRPWVIFEGHWKEETDYWNIFYIEKFKIAEE
ncbi:MAG: hypothetical protein OXB93_03010 [Cytophagales bacterium]|nr:hypothetical protein [Cytophagales bacterium]